MLALPLRAQELLNRIQSLREKQWAEHRQQVMNLITAADSLQNAFTINFPNLAKTVKLPQISNDDAVRLWKEWQYAEQRLSECQGCHGKNLMSKYDMLPDVTQCQKPVLASDGAVQWESCPIQESYRARELAKRLLGQSQIPERFKRRTLDRFEVHSKASEIALSEARDFITGWHDGAHEPELKGLWIEGGNGTGKTHLAVGIMLTLIERGVACRFYTAPELVATVRNAIDEGAVQDTLDALASVSLLVLDDLGKEYISTKTRGSHSSDTWVNEILFLLINKRYENDRPLILTTNLSEGEIRERYGPAIYSRLAEMCRLIILDGSDYRLKEVAM